MTIPEESSSAPPLDPAATRPSQVVAGVRIAALDLRAAASAIADLTGQVDGHAVFTCNVDHAMLIREDPDFAAAYAAASLVTADGAPLVALARLLGGPVAERVTGADLVPALAAEAQDRGLRLVLVGGGNGVASTAAERLSSMFPGLSVHAVPPPPFGFAVGDVDDQRLVASLRAVGPAVVIVCFGAPKQELWIHQHRGELPGQVLLGAGASLDFLAGVQRRAPQLWQRLGVEFLWRLLTNWRRLWRRYLLRDSRFAWVALHELWMRGTAGQSQAR